MNKQISDLTGLILTITEKLSSNIGEGNSQSTASDKACARSDSGPSALEWFCTSFFGCLQNQASVLMVKVLRLQKKCTIQSESDKKPVTVSNSPALLFLRKAPKKSRTASQ